MKAYGVWEDEDVILFATYESADAYQVERLREWWPQIVDPTRDIPGMGSATWRAKHYAALGFDAYLEQRRKGFGGYWVEEYEVRP